MTDVEATRLSDHAIASPDGAVVSVLSGLAKGAQVRIPGEVGDAIKVGKHESNDLVLPDDTVSRVHMSIGRGHEGIVIRDLGSTNGVKIGGARVKEAVVAPGTIVRAGDVDLLIRVELQGVEIPASDEERFGIALGRTLIMRRIFGLLERISPTNATVLLTGETGTGKDVLARSIHMQSPRRTQPFEVVDCGAVSHSLIESELFGHERGAFTGAVAARAGAFERAGGGTIFLDEIGELPLDLQPKLLRVLEAREFRRVGGNKPLNVDVRVIAATTRDLPREVRKGKFREDLFFRLAVVPIQVPPLRSRIDDIPLLARRILEASTPEGERALHISESTLGTLRAHDWPGNVRELRNALERAAFLTRASGGDEIEAVELDVAPVGEPADEADLFRFRAGMTYREARGRIDAVFERRYLQWILERHGWNVSAAAREAQMDRKYLAELARKHRVIT